MATKSIGATGRDYATPALWASYLSGLGTLSAPEIGELYNDAEFGSANVSWTGFTTSATNTVTIRCAAGQSFKDHASVRSNALTYDQSKGVGIVFSSSHQWTNIANYFFIQGIQFKRKASSYANACIDYHSTATGGHVKDCIILKNSTTSHGVTNIRDNKVINTVFICTTGTANPACSLSGSTANGEALNCTL